jgi:hypothetical protein
MKKLVVLSLAVLPLAACSGLPTASTQGASSTYVSTAGEQYCFKRNLVQSDGKLYCNWVADRDQACTARADRGVEVTRYSDPAPAGRCDTGEYLVKVAPKA